MEQFEGFEKLKKMEWNGMGEMGKNKQRVRIEFLIFSGAKELTVITCNMFDLFCGFSFC